MKKLIFVFFTLICFKANSAESINDWSGLYLGVYQSEDKLSANATSVTWPSIPYSVSTDQDTSNFGIFLGYNYSINNIILGVETSYQDKVGEDRALPDLNGSVVYDDMAEYKLKIGYLF